MFRLSFPLALLAGCNAVPTLDDGFEAQLTRTGGCADLYAFAVDEDDEIMLEVLFDGVLDAAQGVDTNVTTALPDPSVEITVSIGRAVSDAACDDLIINGGPEVDEVWTVVSGDVALDVTHVDEEPVADIALTDATFVSPDGDEVTVEAFSWDGITVGWFAG